MTVKLKSMPAKDFKEIRKLLELTKKGMADLLSLSSTHIYNYETGHTPIPPVIGLFLNQYLRSKGLKYEVKK